MRTTLDQTGRIELPDSVQSQLGVKAGDDLLWENHGGRGVIMAAGLEPQESQLLAKGREY